VRGTAQEQIRRVLGRMTRPARNSTDGGAEKRHNILRIKATVEKERCERGTRGGRKRNVGVLVRGCVHHPVHLGALTFVSVHGSTS
jgi:hypothetical protein